MPRSKKNVKRTPDAEAIENAMKAILNNEPKLSVRAACKQFKVSKTTVLRQLNLQKENYGQPIKYRNRCDVKKVFSLELENMLVAYLTDASNYHYGLTKNEVTSFAYQYACTNKKPFPGSWNATTRELESSGFEILFLAISSAYENQKQRV